MQSSIQAIKLPSGEVLTPMGYAHAEITEMIKTIFLELELENPNVLYEEEALGALGVSTESRAALMKKVVDLDNVRRRAKEPDGYDFSTMPICSRKFYQNANRALKKIASPRWSGEFLRLAIYFVYLMDLVEFRPREEAQSFVQKFRSNTDAFFNEFRNVRKKFTRRKPVDDHRDKDRKRIVGLAIDEILRNPGMKVNTAISNAWDFWMKKSKAMQSFDGKEYGQDRKRNNLKRRYFKNGVSKETVFKKFLLSKTGSFKEFYDLRDQLPTDFGNSRVSLFCAEKLYLLVEKKIKLQEENIRERASNISAGLPSVLPLKALSHR